jgi:hypothetical protein
MNTYEQQLEELRTGKLTSITIEKDDFLAFREVLVKREDFKHIRGIIGSYHTYDFEARS